MKVIIGRIALTAFILLVMGCHNKMNNEELRAMQNDCKQNIFHELRFTLGNREQGNPLIVQHIKDEKNIEEFTVVLDKDKNYITKKTIYGDDAYLLKIDNKIYVLTELKGRYNTRCTMFGCDPACDINGYKINNQKKFTTSIHIE